MKYHWLHGGSSPVLMVPRLCYRRSCDFLTFTLTTQKSRPVTHFNAKCHKGRGFTHRCAICSKIRNFSDHMSQEPRNAKNLANFVRELETILRLRVRHWGIKSKLLLLLHRISIKESQWKGNVGWEITICTKIWHSVYRARDIADGQWRFAQQMHCFCVAYVWQKSTLYLHVWYGNYSFNFIAILC